MLTALPLLLSLILVIACASESSGAMYYKFEGTEMNAPDWPASFLKYDLLVANPGLTPDVLQKLRADLPGIKLVAYTCMGWAYVSQPCTNCTTSKTQRCVGCPSSRCVDTVDDVGKPYWNESWNLRNLHDNRPICPYGGLNNKVDPVAAWIPQADSVSAMVRFHVEKTLVGYDGIYIDGEITSSVYA